MLKGRKRISPSDNAYQNEAQSEYLIFKGLSGDSAHPSAKALSRHVPTNADGYIEEFFIEAPMNTQDLGFTLHFATTAMLNAMGLYVDIQPGADAEAIIKGVETRYDALADETLLLNV